MDNVATNEKPTKEYKLGGITGKGFMPGQSGNPSGQHRNPMKEFSRERFDKMTPKEKLAFLKKVKAIDEWKMAEGNPENDVNIQGEITTKVISIDE